MKKILAFLIIVGIVIGVFTALRENFLNKDVEPIIQEVNNNEVYISELNIPLIEVDTLNPILTNNKQVSDVLKLIYESLFVYDEKNKIQPALASEWSEKDSLTWIIKLNKNASWHSGKEFRAEDVIFSYEAIKNADKSVYKDNIKNILSIEKLDDTTVQVNLISEDKLCIYDLTFPIIPKYYFNNDLENEIKNNSPVGTGAYKYDSLVSEKVLKLVNNNFWWKNEDFKLKDIYLYKYASYGEAIKAFKSTEIDLIPTTMSSWQKKFGMIGINSYAYESSEFETIIPNIDKTILRESSVRRMLLSAINTENILEKIYNGNGKSTSCPVQSISHLNSFAETNSYDSEKAKQLLINAGWENNTGAWQKEINGKRYTLSFNLLVNKEKNEFVEIAKLIEENLSEIGVKLKIVSVSSKEYHKRIKEGNFELALATINLNQELDMLKLIKSNVDTNFARYENAFVDDIIKNVDYENINSKFLEIQDIYKNETPYIGMYYKCSQLLTNKSVKGNIKPTNWNVYHNITGWCK